MGSTIFVPYVELLQRQEGDFDRQIGLEVCNCKQEGR